MSLGSIRPAILLACCIAIVLAALPARADEVLDLPIGDPARRDRSAAILLDGITDTAVGDQITPSELAARLDGVRMLLVGESHTSMEFHRVQLRILQELVARGRKVSIGLEMYPVSEQSWLDRWSTDPSFDEELFLRESHWYRNWTYHWNYYREIFRLAHERRLPMYGLNVPREVVQTMRKEGRQALTAEQANLLPERIETQNEEHRRLFRAFFSDSEGLHGGMTDQQFEGMFRAQCTWDGAMAHNALRALEGAADDSAILVVLVGSGHVAYGLGVERQARLAFAGRIASVLPIEVEDEETKLPVRAARASYASFFWGIPLERDPLYPVLGVSLAERPAGERLPVLYVANDSVAAAAGFELGDLLLSMDGVQIDDKETLHRLMSGKRWADAARFSVRRGEEDIELVALFRRSPPEATEPGATESGRTHHALRVELDPAAGRLAVVDEVDLPRGGEVEFLLHARLSISGSKPRVAEVPLGDVERFTGINSAPVEREGAGELRRYRVTLPAAGGTLRLEYAGAFDFGLDDPEQEYARGMRETSGIVSATGVYLAGNGFWYPVFGDGLIEFDLEAPVPSGWQLISQGDGVSRGDDGEARWSSAGPADEIYLVGGPLTLYRRPAGAAEAQVYLRAPDDALADRYLGATADYLEMYTRLIGPYPYRKFALVENFWETGYGMPSFTLLGSQVIRLPFILASSYPHEILHNWWGNSVFVDYASGNWCEGLTAYLADHLIQEQNGRGTAYRRDALQRFRSYVSAGRDFPLVDFRSRHSAATEAVGYGKTLMGFHMLRHRVGDEAFRAWLAAFYAEERGRRASFADVRRTLEKVSGRDLGRFFAEWTGRTGAPALAVEIAGVEVRDGGYTTRGTLRQTQAGAPYDLEIPVVLQTAGAPISVDVALGAMETRFAIESPERPLALHVDPAFDLFRALDPLEIPPSIGQIFGEQRVLAVVAATTTPDRAIAYAQMIEAWASEHQQPEIVTDSDIDALPADRGIWLLGRDNRFAREHFGARAELQIGASSVSIHDQQLAWADHTLVAVTRNPSATDRAIGWIAADPVAAIVGLARKLPHYGKYSYLGFEGSEPTNVLKGQWSGADSPLTIDLRPEAERNAPLAPLTIEPEPALVPGATAKASGARPGAARPSS